MIEETPKKNLGKSGQPSLKVLISRQGYRPQAGGFYTWKHENSTIQPPACVRLPRFNQVYCNPLRQRQTGKKYNPGRDITLSAPKSVSLLGLVKGDTRVIEAQKNSVANTLKYIESNCIFTRTGKGGVNRQQIDNALIAIFHHKDLRLRW